MYEPLRRVTPADEPLLAGLLVAAPLVEAVVGLAIPAPAACGEPVAAWVWWCSGVVVPVAVLC